MPFAIIYGFTFRETISVIGIGTGADDKGVKGIFRMDMCVAEISIFGRVALDFGYVCRVT